MDHMFSSFKFIGGVFVTVFRIGYCIGADLHIVIQKRREAPQSALLVVLASALQHSVTFCGTVFPQYTLFAPDYSIYTTCDSLINHPPAPGERRSSLGHVACIYTCT